MKARCLNSFFTQKISGTIGQTIEIQDQATFDELVKVGYVEAHESEQQNVGNTPQEVTKASKKEKKVNDENESK
jgi:hypothetical protein